MQVAIQVLVGAIVGLALAGAVVYFLLTRAPLVFVADKLSVGLFSGADEVGELVTGSDGVDEAGFDPNEPGAAPFDDGETAASVGDVPFDGDDDATPPTDGSGPDGSP